MVHTHRLKKKSKRKKPTKNHWVIVILGTDDHVPLVYKDWKWLAVLECRAVRANENSPAGCSGIMTLARAYGSTSATVVTVSFGTNIKKSCLNQNAFLSLDYLLQIPI